ncbi:hypothetical protein B484DRAFT_167621 [Ochromonadaceae sp. CCMP2298]|nr:hypothetical protein B484DRAFT_167621 [Ochromonadaceae sp. CCMP2298]
MAAKNLICKVTDTIKNFSDSYHYYRFKEDESAAACLGNCNAGNNTGNTTGQGGCKWSFAPHTAHNSYILDVGLAEEIERAVAGASVEARLHAFRQLRQRVREQAEEGGGWMLSQSTEVNNTKVSVYQRKRPRGDWANVKMTGMAGETPVGFIQGIMNFSKRRQWEGMFEDGVTVEAIDLGEPLSALLQEDADENVTAQALRSADPDTAPLTPPMSPLPVCLPQSQPPPAVEQGGEQEQGEQEQGEQGGKGASRLLSSLQRKTDDVNTFLQTVDVAAVPQGMAIAFLNDPERQHALSHLRKMMMASNPRECMLCNAFFNSNADIRCCPCCAMVSCASCVCKRVFETVSRQTVSVCVHCYRESSRIRQPPQVVVDARGVKESIRGKWWRPEDLAAAAHHLLGGAGSSCARTPW